MRWKGLLMSLFLCYIQKDKSCERVNFPLIVFSKLKIPSIACRVAYVRHPIAFMTTCPFLERTLQHFIPDSCLIRLFA